MYAFQELCCGPRWRDIKVDFVRKSQAEAFALDWFRKHDYEILDHDTCEEAIDFMVAKGGHLYQYAVQPA
jgi:hypothetical protein